MQSYFSRLLQEQGLLSTTADHLGMAGGVLFSAATGRCDTLGALAPCVGSSEALYPAHRKRNWDDRAPGKPCAPAGLSRGSFAQHLHAVTACAWMKAVRCTACFCLLLRLWLIIVGTDYCHSSNCAPCYRFYDQRDRAREVPSEGLHSSAADTCLERVSDSLCITAAGA